ncbi:phosphonate ABC transporter, permease protein PhnE [Streptomyces sp. GESEQ-35]|uniref:phosphonate ABC transporter, permease protein PhnE n=1 Tax=Streptomyces sp. GESEQ-35 TaxID=2812657 RepID=UPI001B32AE77|nr:phosphonate ABC transporter, permease protein PhnE [Streptomyces sp. GESEQ-35]
MTVQTTQAPKTPPPTQPVSLSSASRTLARPRAGGVAALLVMAALLGFACWTFVDLRINVATSTDSASNAVDFSRRMFPLDFPPLGELLKLCGQTMAIVVCATALSVVLSLPVAVLAAGNTTPHPTARFAARGVIVLARAVPDVVLAIVFFRIFGLGALTGILAMGLHSVGMVGKMYADAVEQIDEGPRTAVRATGASRIQQLISGVLPQVLPALVANALHRLDINLRVSVVLGFVGVNGLGFAIAESLGSLNYQRGMALALVVLVLCVLVELLSGAIRRALLRNTDAGNRRAAPGWVPAPRLRAEGVTRPPAKTAAPDPARINPPWTPRRARRAGYAVTSLLALAACIWGADLSAGQFLGALGNIVHTLGLFWPPETGGILPTLLTDLFVTVKIAFAATLIGAVLALPIGALAARNVSPSPATATAFRTFVVLVRGIPELVLAIVFVVITGLGAVAGALALGVGAVGLLGKLVADSLEEVDPGVEAAVRATGAARWQVFWSATLPQARPALVGHVLYQLDTNIRSATLLGIVGAGGIGFDLLNASRVLEFGVVTTVLLLVFGTVLLVELLAVWLRRIVR